MDHLGLSGGLQKIVCLKNQKYTPKTTAGPVYSNMVNRAEILNEKAVYERLDAPCALGWQPA